MAVAAAAIVSVVLRLTSDASRPAEARLCTSAMSPSGSRRTARTPSRAARHAAGRGDRPGGGDAGAPDTPVRLAETAFAFGDHEVAAYRDLHGLARRAGDGETAAIVERILEQEEAAAELVAGTLELTLDAPPTSPLPAVTPIGKPSERAETRGTGHPGPQQAHETAPDEPLEDTSLAPERVDAQGSTPIGHPAGTTSPPGGGRPNPTRPRENRARCNLTATRADPLAVRRLRLPRIAGCARGFVVE